MTKFKLMAVVMATFVLASCGGANDTTQTTDTLTSTGATTSKAISTGEPISPGVNTEPSTDLADPKYDNIDVVNEETLSEENSRLDELLDTVNNTPEAGNISDDVSTTLPLPDVSEAMDVEVVTTGIDDEEAPIIEESPSIENLDQIDLEIVDPSTL